MIQVGRPPYLECSSRGDTRFSAFHAYVNGKTIEEQYQAAKIFPSGETNLPWQEAKGRQATNHGELATLYKSLWRQYLKERPFLVQVLQAASGLSDMFGQPGHVCQAVTLWELRNEFPYVSY